MRKNHIRRVLAAASLNRKRMNLRSAWRSMAGLSRRTSFPRASIDVKLFTPLRGVTLPAQLRAE